MIRLLRVSPSPLLVGELRRGSQPTAATCVVWSWRLIDCFARITAVGGFWDVGFPRSLPPFIVCRFGQSHYNNTSKERNLSTNHGTFVSSVHLFRYLVMRNRLNKGREDHPFNFLLSCARVFLKFLQFALTKPAPATQASANTRVTRSGLSL